MAMNKGPNNTLLLPHDYSVKEKKKRKRRPTLQGLNIHATATRREGKKGEVPPAKSNPRIVSTTTNPKKGGGGPLHPRTSHLRPKKIFPGASRRGRS